MPDWIPAASESWKLTLACTRAEADAATDDASGLAGFAPMPTLVVSELDPMRPDDWVLEAYCEGTPTRALVAAVRALAPSSGLAPRVQRLDDADWVTLSQAGLTPIRAGRFLVHAGPLETAPAPGTIAFRIDAGRAFGTGHHETTAGCLAMLDRLAAAGVRFGRIADIGTGTGLLAFAAQALWPDAAILASDIDPIAIEVTRANMAVNAIPPGALVLAAADGVEDPAIAAAAPFDLLVANILAGPLIALAPAFARVVAPGGTVLLAGLLANQAAAVTTAYDAAGFALAEQAGDSAWPVLRLTHRGDLQAAPR